MAKEWVLDGVSIQEADARQYVFEAALIQESTVTEPTPEPETTTDFITMARRRGRR